MSIPDFVFALPHLRTLAVSHNRVNIGLVHTTFPNLKELDIRHNPSIIIAGPDKLPAISRYYHDAALGNALVPEGRQWYSKR